MGERKRKKKKAIPSGPTHLDLPQTAFEQMLRKQNALLPPDGGKRGPSGCGQAS